MDMRRRSTFCSRASASKRSSGPSKPSRLTISSPSPGAMTSGPAVLKPSAGGGLTGSFMSLRFNPAGAPAATVFGPALSPFRQQRLDASRRFGKPRPSQRIPLPGENPAAALEPAFGSLGHGAGAAGDLDHLVHAAVAVKR